MFMLNFIYITVCALILRQQEAFIGLPPFKLPVRHSTIVNIHNAAQELDQYQPIAGRSPSVCRQYKP
jgi:hypothetical protein